MEVVQTLLDTLLNYNKIKYVKLDELLPRRELTRHINFYIDMSSLFDIVFMKNNLEELRSLSNQDKLTISSQLTNIIAHYRHYFYSRHNASTSFYILYSNDINILFRKLYPDYKSNYYNLRISDDNINTRSLRNSIKTNIKLFSHIVKYIPDAYLINTMNNEVGSTMQYLISTDDKPDNLNIVLTNDKIHYQLVNTRNTFILTDKSDHSKLITKSNVFKYLTKKEENITLSPELLPLIFAITGHINYNVVGLKGYKYLKTIKFLTKCIESDLLINDKYSSISKLVKDLADNNLIKEDSMELLKTNFQIFNYENQVKLFTESYLDFIDSCFINNTDYDQLMNLSNKYYQYQPLMFLELVETYK